MGDVFEYAAAEATGYSDDRVQFFTHLKAKTPKNSEQKPYTPDNKITRWTTIPFGEGAEGVTVQHEFLGIETQTNRPCFKCVSSGTALAMGARVSRDGGSHPAFDPDKIHTKSVTYSIDPADFIQSYNAILDDYPARQGACLDRSKQELESLVKARASMEAIQKLAVVEVPEKEAAPFFAEAELKAAQERVHREKVQKVWVNVGTVEGRAQRVQTDLNRIGIDAPYGKKTDDYYILLSRQEYAALAQASVFTDAEKQKATVVSAKDDATGEMRETVWIPVGARDDAVNRQRELREKYKIQAIRGQMELADYSVRIPDPAWEKNIQENSVFSPAEMATAHRREVTKTAEEVWVPVSSWEQAEQTMARLAQAGVLTRYAPQCEDYSVAIRKSDWDKIVKDEFVFSEQEKKSAKPGTTQWENQATGASAEVDCVLVRTFTRDHTKKRQDQLKGRHDTETVRTKTVKKGSFIIVSLADWPNIAPRQPAQQQQLYASPELALR